MISELQLKNFKSLNMDSAISLSKFSLLCGSNSSGKSSIIQSILMLCQSFSNRLLDNNIVLNGHLCRLGSYQDIRSHRASDDEVRLKIRIPLDRQFGYEGTKFKEINLQIAFGRRSKKNNPEDDYHPVIAHAAYEVVSENASGESNYDYVSLRQSHDDDQISSSELYPYHGVERFIASRHDKINKEFPEYEVIGASKTGIMPTSFIIQYDYTKKLSHYVIALLTHDSEKRRRAPEMLEEDGEILLPKCFFQSLKSVIEREREYLKSSLEIPSEIMKLMRKTKGLESSLEQEVKRQMIKANFALDPEIIDLAFSDLPVVRMKDWKFFINTLDDRVKKNIITLVDKYRLDLQEAWYAGTDTDMRRTTFTSRIFSDANEILTQYFSRSVKYLGPLRNEPQAVYSSVGYVEPNSVGLKGEYTAAALHINRNKVIRYHSPIPEGTYAFNSRERLGTVKEACQDWLSYLGVVEKFHTRDKGKLGYELHVQVDQGEYWQDLTHVGVGVSQVLPIVLMFLLSTPDDILIFEQPELHLHPKVQSRLCDLFITMAKAGRQCIVETHSEYLVNRLRLRIAQSIETPINNESSIYFISKENGKSSFEKVDISPYGSINNWPKDFFDQTDREVETIMMAAARKKKMERQGNAGNN